MKRRRAVPCAIASAVHEVTSVGAKGRRWASWAGASWGACLPMPRSRWAISPPCSTPTPPARPGGSATTMCRPLRRRRLAWPQLAERCAAVTTEFENVPARALRATGAPGRWRLAATPWPWRRTARRKGAFHACGVACAPYAVIETRRSWRRCPMTCCPASSRRPAWATTAKGQIRVKTRELAAAWAATEAGALRAGKDAAAGR
jgi:hypothetical protein